jgi:DNA ligase 1
MKRFAALFAELDATTSTNAKVEALQRYFEQAPAHDAAWAVYFLAGGKPRQVVPTAQLAILACEVAGIQPWLFDECYQAVGDLAETIAHVLPRDSEPTDVGLAEWVEQRLLPLRGLAEAEIAARMKAYWRELDAQGRFLLTKLVGGGFRVGVSKLLVQRALAAHAGVDAKRVAQRMMGYTDGKVMPSVERFQALIAQHEEGAQVLQDEGQPYPFFLAHQLDAPPEVFASKLGPPTDWQVEWKYDGIRGQVVKRSGQVWAWSRGEELVTERFPEIEALARQLPDGTVLDGEIMVWKDEPVEPPGTLIGRPAPFALLQQRIGRKTLTKKVLADAPVTFMAVSWPTTCWSRAARTSAPWHSANGAPGSKPCWKARRSSSRRSRPEYRGWSSPSGGSSRANSVSRGSCSSAWMPPMAPAAPRQKACGGSGRSTR